MEKLSALDIGVFAAYFVIVTFIGFFVGRKKKESARDYFVTSSRLPWYLIAFGMLASSISTEQFIGEAGFSYKWGLAVFNWELANWPAMLILLWIFLPVYLNKQIVTMPSYLEQRFGPGPRNLYAVISILTAVLIILPGVTYTGGFLLNDMFGIPTKYGIWLLAIFSGVFTIYGGMISVAWAQLFQAVLLLASGILVFFLAITKIEGGFSAIVWSAVPARNHMILPFNHPALPWTSIIVLAFPVNIWYFCTSQPIIQSCLGAKSRWDGKMGIILLGFMMFLTSMSVAFPGLVAYALNPNLEVPDKAYPFVVKQLVSTGMKGLVLAGLCGAVMSTIEALMHSSSAIFTMDLYARFKTNAPDKHLILVGRAASTAILITGAIFAPVVGSFHTIFEFFQNCWFFIAAPVAAVFILAMLWKRTTPKAAFWALMLCLPLFALPHMLLLAEKKFGWQINQFNLAGIIFLLMCLFVFVISLLTKPLNPEKIKGLVWEPAIMKLPQVELEAGYPWYKNLWLWCAIWVAVMIFVYIKLW